MAQAQSRRKLSKRNPPASTAGATRHGARSEHAYRRLRDAIQAGTLKPGQRIMEIEIADWLKVSRTPVRDAMRRLESEGMVTHRPRIGLVIAELDRQAVMELYAMREVLESTAARLCARHASDMETDELLDLVKTEQQLAGDFSALAQHNQRFHDAIRRGAHNRYLVKSISAVNDSMALLGKSQMLLPHRARTALTEHAEIARAIAKRDADGAEEAIRKHVRAAQRERMKQLFPER